MAHNDNGGVKPEKLSEIRYRMADKTFHIFFSSPCLNIWFFNYILFCLLPTKNDTKKNNNDCLNIIAVIHPLSGKRRKRNTKKIKQKQLRCFFLMKSLNEMDRYNVWSTICKPAHPNPKPLQNSTFFQENNEHVITQIEESVKNRFADSMKMWERERKNVFNGPFWTWVVSFLE